MSDRVQALDARYWTSTRRELRRWLCSNAPDLAELYHGAVELLYGQSPPGLGRFVAHAVREIRNRLPDSIPGVVGTHHSNRVDVYRLDALAISWQKIGPSLSGLEVATADEESMAVTIPRALAYEIDETLRDYGTGRKSNRERFAEMYAAQAGAESADGPHWAVLATHWRDTTEWAPEEAHVGRPCSSDAELRQRFELFESALSSLLLYFFNALDDIDEILDRANRS